MTRRFPNILWLALALACGSALADNGIRWAPDISTARKAAAQFNVPLLIHFYGDNCLPCRMLEERVYSQAEAIETLNTYFICVKVNASQRIETAREFQVHSWPTDVFVSPDGKTLYQGVSQQDLRSYLSTLQNVAVMNRDRNIMLAAQKPLASPMQGAYVAQQQYVGPQANAEQHQYNGREGVNQLVANPNQPGMTQIQGQTAAYQAPARPPQGGLQPGQAFSPNLAQQLYPRGSTPAHVAPTQTSEPPFAALTIPYPDDFPQPANQVSPGNSAQTSIVAHPNQNVDFGARNSTVAGMLPSEVRSNINSGPLTIANQPQAIAGAVQGFNQQVAPNFQTPVGQDSGHLAPPKTGTYVTSGPSPEAGRSTSLQSFAAVSTVPASAPPNGPTNQSPFFNGPTGGPQQTSFGRASNSRNVGAQLVSNPFYPNDEGTVDSIETPTAMQSGSRLTRSEDGRTHNPSELELDSAKTGAPTDVSTTPSFAMKTIATDDSARKPSDTNDPTTEAVDLAGTSSDRDEKAEPNLASSMTQPLAIGLDQMDQSTEAALGHAKDDVAASPAIGGYCPVALKRKGEWVAGDAQYSIKHRGRVYWLSSQLALEEFLQAPDASSPVLSGFDPLVFLEEGKLVDGSLQFGLHEQVTGAFLLFSSADSKKKYWEHFDHYSAALNAVLNQASAQ